MLTQLNEVKKSGYFAQGDIKVPIQKRVPNAMHPATEVQQFTLTARCTSSPEISLGLSIFTDGSKLDGHVGCAFVVFQNAEETHYEQYQLPVFCSVFQAELIAIRQALEYLIGLMWSLLGMMPLATFTPTPIRHFRPSTTELVRTPWSRRYTNFCSKSANKELSRLSRG